MRRIRSVLMLLGAGLILLHSPPLQAQLGPSLRGAGMAGAYAGLARGHEAAGWNPALLGLADRPGWSVALPAFDLSALMLGPDVLEMYDVLSKGSERTTGTASICSTRSRTPVWCSTGPGGCTRSGSASGASP